MPAQRLGPDPTTIGRFDVLGFDSPNMHGFVRHLAIASCSYVNYERRIGLRVTHMMPPLQDDAPSHPCHCHGTLALADDEVRRIDVFVELIRGEYAAEKERRQIVRGWTRAARDQFRADQYTICPHVRYPTSDRPFHRFNCAGFVFEAYLAGGVQLLQADEQALPGCSLEALQRAYPDLADRLGDQQLRHELGLAGEGPWPVLLPGHILNAMIRERDEIVASAYLAKHGDEFFPARPVSTK